MSFKREGDDISLLRNLKNRRVAELLATHIPEDEALLLKNGRYTCLVCRHRPICDTLDILAIHRKGRKHLENLSTSLRKQEEMKSQCIQKQFIKTGNSTITIAKGIRTEAQKHPSSSKVSPLLKEIPYRSRCKRKVKVTDRKITLDIKSGPNNMLHSDGSTVVSPSQTVPSPAANATVKSYLDSIKHKGSFEELVEKSRNLSYLPISISAATAKPAHAILTRKQKKPLQRNGENQADPPNESQRKKADYFLNLRRDGWKKNLDGTWTKDEQAEFDSDEETPPEFVE